MELIDVLIIVVGNLSFLKKQVGGLHNQKDYIIICGFCQFVLTVTHKSDK
jgi:hypothetical protein